MRTFKPGTDWVWYAPHGRDSFDEKEIQAVTKALEDGWLTVGPVAKQFEARVADIYGKKHGLFVNSGSSANLLAFEILALPAGSEVITAACNFNTTVAPIVQKNLAPVFVDVKEGMYTIDPARLEAAVSEKTKAIIVPHLIGNIADLGAIQSFAKAHDLAVIEDSCDTIGSKYRGQKTGVYSDITTTSFYASHLITTGGAGGMVMLDDDALRERARIFRDWGRGITKHDDDIRERLSTYEIDGRPYDSAFVFVERGYNMRPTEMQAAFGVVQLGKLEERARVRMRNFSTLRERLSKYEDRIILPMAEKDAESHWLAFPITFRADSKIERNDFARYLEERKVQTRPLFSGNIVKHAAYKGIGRTAGDLSVSDVILKSGLLIGLHHGITPEMLDYVCETIDSYFARS